VRHPDGHAALFLSCYGRPVCTVKMFRCGITTRAVARRVFGSGMWSDVDSLPRFG
jgi:hypothetical protein